MYLFFQMLDLFTENPWKIKSLYEFQYFNCPVCHFKTEYFKTQDFVNHAHASHPESTNYLRKINDGSLDDIDFPWAPTTVSENIANFFFRYYK